MFPCQRKRIPTNNPDGESTSVLVSCIIGEGVGNNSFTHWEALTRAVVVGDPDGGSAVIGGRGLDPGYLGVGATSGGLGDCGGWAVLDDRGDVVCLCHCG